jgi:nicotinate-nucleotide adenylyltransferase
MNNHVQKIIGIFGGTFNPPHIAHSIVADSVREQLKLDRILFIPAGNHPLKESIDAGKRFEMARLAFSHDENFEVSDIEIISKENKTYTVDTLNVLKNIYGNNSKLCLIIGADNLIQLPEWKEPEKLFEMAEVIVINRPNFNITDPEIKFIEKVKFVNVPFLEISSSMIRQNVREGRSIKYLVEENVREYIYKNKLYKVP